MKIKKIFVGMDGILTNFLYGALDRLGRLDLYDNWPLGQWNIAEVLGITKKQYWDIIDQDSFGFWSNLPCNSNYLDVCNRIEATASDIGADMYICTNPTLNADSIHGKVVWLQKAFYPKFTEYVVTPRKTTIAGEDSILIDTSDNAVQSFIDRGGYGISYPNIDNSYKRYVTDDDITAITNRIKELA